MRLWGNAALALCMRVRGHECVCVCMSVCVCVGGGGTRCDRGVHLPPEDGRGEDEGGGGQESGGRIAAVASEASRGRGA